MYKIFNKYVLRTPLFSVNYFLNLTKDKLISDEKLLSEFENPIIKESIYLASPVLFEELNKWSENKIKDTKDKNKIRNSFLKYLSRLSSRCTPFGLFAGSCLGSLDNNNSIIIDDQNNERNTRLDMNLTGLIIRSLEEVEQIKVQLLFYPNTSIYYCANQIRYVESNLVNERLLYQIIEIDNSEYLTKIIDSCSKGLNISELSNMIIDDEISKEDAVFFINELIENQVLVSEIKQTVSGEESLNQLLKVLEKIDCPCDLVEKLELIRVKLKELDTKIGNNIEMYQEIIDLIHSFKIIFNEKYVFQTDLIVKTKSNHLNIDLEKKIIECLEMLNKNSFHTENKDMIDFKNLFIERYENREMPMSTVLDNENGIGYPIKMNNETNSLIKGLSFYNNSTDSSKKIDWTNLQSLLLQKISHAAKHNLNIIKINETDFKDAKVNWDNLPATFTTVLQIVKVNGEETIVMSAVGGSSATNYLGRFCHGDNLINNFVNEVCDFEEKYHENKILAEIIHLPEDRIGNILTRPSFRNYEIPYLSHSLKLKEKQINIDDILISVRNNKIVLRSQKRNLEIIPILSNAHNYSTSSLPIYRFLCDVQFNEKRNFLGFDTSFFGNEFSYLPRIIYKDVILALAKWIIDSSEIKQLMKIIDEILFIEDVIKWTKEKKLPKYVYFIEGDNKLLVNLSNITSVKMFFSLAIKLNKIMIEEFLFEETNSCINLNNDHFVNEFIFTFTSVHLK